MTTTDLYEYIKNEKPSIIHVSGKTSVGKTTFSNKIAEDFGYKVIPLDDVVQKYVIAELGLSNTGAAFMDIYKNRSNADWTNRFVSGIHQEINSALGQNSNVIIDGALANVETLKEVIGTLPSCLIIFLHPENLEIYKKYLLNRFEHSSSENNASLPLRFWDFIGKKELSQFFSDRIITPAIEEAVKSYAKESQSVSLKRRAEIQDQFKDVLVVNV